MPRGAKSLAPQLKSWLVRQSLHSQRSVSEHQWLRRTTVITHVLHIGIVCETHTKCIEALYCPLGIVALTYIFEVTNAREIFIELKKRLQPTD
jgi:hypothetical protein